MVFVQDALQHRDRALGPLEKWKESHKSWSSTFIPVRPLVPEAFLILLMDKILHHQSWWLSHHLYRVLTIPGGAGFCPSTVFSTSCSRMEKMFEKDVEQRLRVVYTEKSIWPEARSCGCITFVRHTFQLPTDARLWLKLTPPNLLGIGASCKQTPTCWCCRNLVMKIPTGYIKPVLYSGEETIHLESI